MKGKLSASCLSIILTAALCLVMATPDAWAESRMLPKDTKLHPQGWTVGNFIKFKKDTSVALNDLGEVVSGTLAKDTFLLPRGWKRVINDYYYYVTAYSDAGPFPHRYYHPFLERRYNIAIPGYGHLLYKGGTTITFSENGDVTKGTLAEKATIRLTEQKYGFVTFKSDTVLAFYESGAIYSGVLDSDTHLRPVAWTKHPLGTDSAGFINFSKGKLVMFRENGDLISGTLKEAVKLLAEDGTVQDFPAGSTVMFSEQGATLAVPENTFK